MVEMRCKSGTNVLWNLVGRSLNSETKSSSSSCNGQLVGGACCLGVWALVCCCFLLLVLVFFSELELEVLLLGLPLFFLDVVSSRLLSFNLLVLCFFLVSESD